MHANRGRDVQHTPRASPTVWAVRPVLRLQVIRRSVLDLVDVHFDDGDVAKHLRPSQIQVQTGAGTWTTVAYSKPSQRALHSSRTRDSSQRRAPNNSQDYVYDFGSSDDDEVLEDASDDDSSHDDEVLEDAYDDDLPRPIYISRGEAAFLVSSSQPSGTDVKESVARRVLKHVGGVLLCENPIAAVALEIDPRIWPRRVGGNSGTHVFTWLPEQIRAEVAERAKKALLDMTEYVIEDEAPMDQESGETLGSTGGGGREGDDRYWKVMNEYHHVYGFGGNNDDNEANLHDGVGVDWDESNASPSSAEAKRAVDKFYAERDALVLGFFCKISVQGNSEEFAG